MVGANGASPTIFSWIVTHVHEVVLKPDAKILHLSDRASILEFHKNFSFDLLAEVAPDHQGHPMEMIAWENVAEEFQGMIICPYLWDMELRFNKNMLWYYSWDCSSGCIWDHRAIESIKLIEVSPLPQSLHPRMDEGVDSEVDGA
jgi:hypothetical protein